MQQTKDWIRMQFKTMKRTLSLLLEQKLLQRIFDYSKQICHNNHSLKEKFKNRFDSTVQRHIKKISQQNTLL